MRVQNRRSHINLNRKIIQTSKEQLYRWASKITIRTKTQSNILNIIIGYKNKIST